MTAQYLFREDLGPRRYYVTWDWHVKSPTHRAVRRYLTAAIFPVYILHQTIIVVVAHALKPAHLYPPVEGVLLVLVTAATCFMSYEAIRRVRLAPQLSVPQDIN